MDVQIPLSEEDIRVCQHAADSWMHNHTSQRFLPSNDAYLIGIMGEVALAKYLEIPPQLEVRETGYDEGYDLVVDQWTVQVKSTTRHNGNLLIVVRTGLQAHLASLTIVNRHTNIVTLAGWIDAERHQQLSYQTQFTGEPVWLTPRKNLLSVELLKGIRLLSKGGYSVSPSHIHHPLISGRAASDEVVPF